ncbi:MAG TPA: signal recognition particle receptor subunit alpha, partial [Candidatus Limnocylindria bacterium]|nr:signal recognition particle receptor subunit alpha [Candidatus Limnocylindria bacterium]
MFDFLTQKFSSIFTSLTGKGTLTEQNIQEALAKVQDALLEADVPYALVQTFIADIKMEALGKKVMAAVKPSDQFVKIVHDKLKAFLGGQNAVEFSFQLPSTVMVMGLQGSGKTTSIAKMAHWVQEQAKKRGKTRRILFGSVDFYRPAAVDQLEILSKQVGATFYRATSTDPVMAAQEIQAYAKREFFELVFLDTAGRLHVDSQMLQELRDIDTKLAPRYKILVVDAMTGQESLNVAQAFESGVGYHLALLTKMDSDTRGGAAFAFRYAQKKPIVFVGSGEKIADLELFHPDRMAGRILGMGDVLSLVEKAESTIKKDDQEAMQKSLVQGKLTLQDFANQIAMVNSMGSLSQV